MRVDFYQLSHDPAPAAVALLARKTLEAGERLLVVAQPRETLEAIGQALWEASPESFLANGRAGEGHAARQPILLSETTAATNGARFLLLADGRWRDPGAGFARVMYLFDDGAIEEARATWRALGAEDGTERRFWKQRGGGWVEGP